MEDLFNRFLSFLVTSSSPGHSWLVGVLLQSLSPSLYGSLLYVTSCFYNLLIWIAVIGLNPGGPNLNSFHLDTS